MEDKIRILLVDDELDYINMMQYWLRKKNFDVDVLYNGEQVLEKVKAENYNILFLDLKLPGIDGIDILREIRAFSRKIPIIIFSAYGTKEKLEQAKQLGISGFFSKEKGFNVAVKMICTALRIHKGLSDTEGEK